MKDILFRKRSKKVFVFDKDTANVFDDMLPRSVPFYMEMQRMIGEIARVFMQKNSNIYDLGCSTGTTLVNLESIVGRNNIKLIGVDASQAMLDKAGEKFRNKRTRLPLLAKADFHQPFEIKNASVVILNLTLQFVCPDQRQQFISTIFKGLRKGGCIILIEKVVQDSVRWNRHFEQFYYDFKGRQGYSRLEIGRKKSALRGVLMPYSDVKNRAMLKRCGFVSVESFFKWYIFCGVVAVKP